MNFFCSSPSCSHKMQYFPRPVYKAPIFSCPPHLLLIPWTFIHPPNSRQFFYLLSLRPSKMLYLLEETAPQTCSTPPHTQPAKTPLSRFLLPQEDTESDLSDPQCALSFKAFMTPNGARPGFYVSQRFCDNRPMHHSPGIQRRLVQDAMRTISQRSSLPVDWSHDVWEDDPKARTSPGDSGLGASDMRESLPPALIDQPDISGRRFSPHESVNRTLSVEDNNHHHNLYGALHRDHLGLDATAAKPTKI